MTDLKKNVPELQSKNVFQRDRLKMTTIIPIFQ